MRRSLIDKIVENKNFREMFRFAIVGVIATGIHYGIYLLLNEWINVNIAYTIGYVVSFCCNLWLTAHFTFKTEVTVKRTGGFILSHVVNFLLHIGLLSMFLWMGMSEQLAPIPVYCIAIPINFILVRTVFKRIY
jgi:putative flippase GtrA